MKEDEPTGVAPNALFDSAVVRNIMDKISEAALDGAFVHPLADSPEDQVHELKQSLDSASFEQKLGAACFVVSMGAKATGLRTKAQLMYPLREFSDAGVQREAARFLGDVLLVLLRELPPQLSDKILKHQFESVFSGG